MFGDVVIDADARDPQIVVLRGQVSRACTRAHPGGAGRETGGSQISAPDATASSLTS
jgi:hypothetical protein